MMKEFGNNSDTNKKPDPERKKLDTVTSNVSIKKESEFKKFRQNFFAEDADTMKSQVFTSVIIPGIQRLVADIVKTGIDILLYGSRRDSRDNRNRSVSYSSFYDKNRETSYEKIPPAATKRDFFNFNDVVLFDRGEAEVVLMTLRDQLERYQMVSVADFYDTIGQSAPYTANKYGWRDLSDVTIERVRDGYSFNFPKATPLE